MEVPLHELKVYARLMGYRFETSPDGTEERMYRPDGTLAVVAKRNAPTVGEQVAQVVKAVE